MKKILITALLSSLYANSIYASNLCVGLINYSNEIVEFSTITDPGWIPVVNPSEQHVLSEDFMSSCSLDNLCTIFIREVKTNQYVQINKVSRGTQIILGVNGQYYQDKKADVKCQ